MSRFQKNYKKWKYTALGEHEGRFAISYKERKKLQEDLTEEISSYKSSQIIKDYIQKDANGNYYKENEASRKFEESRLYKEMNIDETDILMNLEVAELVKVDIDKDRITIKEFQDMLQGRQSTENASLVYIFRCHYYLDDKNDIPIYVKLGFGYNRDENKNIQDCLIIKSIHLDGRRTLSKDTYFKDANEMNAVKPSWERNYEFINEWEYQEKHPEDTFDRER